MLYEYRNKLLQNLKKNPRGGTLGSFSIMTETL